MSEKTLKASEITETGWYWCNNPEWGNPMPILVFGSIDGLRIDGKHASQISDSVMFRGPILEPQEW